MPYTNFVKYNIIRVRTYSTDCSFLNHNMFHPFHSIHYHQHLFLINNQINLNDYIKKLNLNHKETICVGDGANDIEMVKFAGIGVSFYGKTALNRVADIHFNNTSLLGLLYAQGYSDNDIIK